MELILNLLWLTVGIFAAIRIGIWAMAQPDTRASQRRVRLAVVATVCAVALMFPIISMTDYMDSHAALVEEAATAKRLVTASTESSLPLLIVSALLASLLSTRIFLGKVTEEFPSPLQAASTRAFSLRGPPSILR